MKHIKIKMAVIGFFVGFIVGCGLGFLGLKITNWFFIRLGKELIVNNWRSVIPAGIVIGLSMAINMANPPFGD